MRSCSGVISLGIESHMTHDMSPLAPPTHRKTPALARPRIHVSILLDITQIRSRLVSLELLLLCRIPEGTIDNF